MRTIERTAQRIRIRSDDRASVCEMAAQIEVLADSVLGLVRDAMTRARAAGLLEEVPIEAVAVLDAVRREALAAHRARSIAVRAEPGLPRIEGDTWTTALLSVLEVLVPTGSTDLVEVSAIAGCECVHFHLRCARAGGACTGRTFDAHDETECREIVESLGGRFELECQARQNVAAKITVPAAAARALSATA